MPIPAWRMRSCWASTTNSSTRKLLLTDIKHAFFCNPLLPAYSDRMPAPHKAAPQADIDVPGGVSLIGHDGSGFAFDNESPRHQVLLRPFRIAARPVSNGEYKAFIEDGGYHRAEFWLSDGWAKVQDEQWEAPLYWLKDDDGSESLFTLAGGAAAGPQCAGRACEFLRGRRLCRLGEGAPAHRVRMGSSGTIVRPWRSVGVDALLLRSLSQFQGLCRVGRRI